MTHPAAKGALLAATALGVIFASAPARAQSEESLQTIEKQIKALQGELAQLKKSLATREQQVKAAQTDAAQARDAARAAEVQATQAAAAAPAAAAAAAAVQPVFPGALPTDKPQLGTFRLGGVTVTLGGFLELAGIYRERNQVSDISTNFGAVPFPQSHLYRENEFRFTARQSRVSLRVEGKPSDTSTVTGYGEMDFQGGAPTSNSVMTNGYTPRLRQAWASYDRNDWGSHLLFGQAYSLVTPGKIGILALKENTPTVIDANNVVGFSYGRIPQVRIAQELLDHQLWLGLSLESPQTVYSIGPNGTGALPSTATVNFNNPGQSGFASTVNYSTDVAPDVVAKVAWDPKFGHFEALGVMNFAHTRISELGGGGSNNTVIGGGGGANFYVPIIRDRLELSGNVLTGYGIGRYSTSSLPDATISQSGSVAYLPELSAMVGIVGHPWLAPDPVQKGKTYAVVDLYSYLGTDQVLRGASFSEKLKGTNTGFGYGSNLYNNTGCSIELSSSSLCQANTQSTVEATVGAWWKFLKGNYGTMQAGVEYAYLRRNTFEAVGGSPHTNNNIFLVSLRYYPFQ